MLNKTLEIRSSPHVKRGITTVDIMRNVVFALLPVVAFAVYAFGISALLTIATTTTACLLTEHLLCRMTGKRSSVGDWSVVITGLLLGMTLPPGLPLWMAAAGGFIGVSIGKFLFGGLGYNAFNPALVGRAALQASFPLAMTTWYSAFAPDRFNNLPASTLTFPLTRPPEVVITGATPLAAFKFDQQMTGLQELAMGYTSGSAGETCGVLILMGGIYLAARKMLNWRTPVAIFATVAVLSAIFHWINPQYPPPLFMLFSGGLMLGAVFMATDMVASPLTSKGLYVYGALIGVLVVVIRFWGGLPEGVMYAILLANAVSPHIDRLIQPVVYGTGKAGGRHGTS